jgi:hypothetical protein
LWPGSYAAHLASGILVKKTAILRRDMAATLNSRHAETFAGKGISTWISRACSEAGDATIWRGFGMKLAFIVALLLAASPVAAQVTTTNQQQQPLGTGGQTNTSTLPNTGIICNELMTATFCNISTSPNNGGYGSGAGAASTSTGITTPSPAIPPCASFPPADEL